MSVTPRCILQGTLLSDSVGTLYTAPASTRVLIDRVTVTNTDSSSRDVTLYIVANGGSVGDRYLITDTLSVNANTTVEITAMKNHVLEIGDFISGLASVADVVSIRISGRTVT